MGCAFDIVCRDCHQSFYLGYGSYSTWYSGELTPTAFEAWASTHPSMLDLVKNQNIQRVIQEHTGHKLEWYGHDYTFLQGRDLVIGASQVHTDVVIPDFASYVRVDMTAKL